jgi:hypothetical protein
MVPFQGVKTIRAIMAEKVAGHGGFKEFAFAEAD